MTTTSIRKKLIAYIAEADDKKVKGLYKLIENDISGVKKFELSDEHFQILEHDREEHLKGKTKSYSREDAKQIIRGEKEL
ncbi:MAG TPA: hypothetical protein VIQ23_03900 [Hanamia sp.]|jgi:hypothetical protein